MRRWSSNYAGRERLSLAKPIRMSLHMARIRRLRAIPGIRGAFLAAPVVARRRRSRLECAWELLAVTQAARFAFRPLAAVLPDSSRRTGPSVVIEASD